MEKPTPPPSENPPSILDLKLDDPRLPKTAELPFKQAFVVNVDIEEPDTTPPYESVVRNYNGVFVVKRMTIEELAQVEVRRTAMTGGMMLSQSIDMVADQITYLEGCLVAWPVWWRPRTMHSAKLINIVWQKVRALHANFRVRVLGE